MVIFHSYVSLPEGSDGLVNVKMSSDSAAFCSRYRESWLEILGIAGCFCIFFLGLL